MDVRNVMLTPQELPGALEECFRAGGIFPLRVTGNSMAPFLKPGRDSVLLSPAGQLRKGDIALFLRPDGSPILHRVVKCAPEGLWFLGDGQSAAEGPVEPRRVIARAEAAIVDGRRVAPGSLRWEFFRRVWCVMALRRLAWRLWRPGRQN